MIFFYLGLRGCTNSVVLPLVAHVVHPWPVPVPSALPLAQDPTTGRHPRHLPAEAVRFKDNLEGLKFEDQSIETLQRYFEGMYDPDLQVEGEGTRWDSLQCTLPYASQQHPRISLRLADKSQKFTQEHHRLFGFPDKHCAKALRTLPWSLRVPSLPSTFGLPQKTLLPRRINCA